MRLQDDEAVVQKTLPTIIGGVTGTQIINSGNSATNALTDTINTGAYAAGICTTIQFGLDWYWFI